MTTQFADTAYYIALLNRDDEFHAQAEELAKELPGRIVTTTWVLTELADAMSQPRNRLVVSSFIEALPSDPNIILVRAEQDLFNRGLEFFARRLDKEWSLTDCISFIVMQENKLADALTSDHHFEQAGFNVLLKQQR